MPHSPCPRTNPAARGRGAVPPQPAEPGSFCSDKNGPATAAATTGSCLASFRSLLANPEFVTPQAAYAGAFLPSSPKLSLLHAGPAPQGREKPLTRPSREPGGRLRLRGHKPQLGANAFFFLFFFLSPEPLQVVREGKVNCRVFKRKARSLASPRRRGRNHSAPAADPTLLSRTCWSVAWGLGTSCLFFLELA